MITLEINSKEAHALKIEEIQFFQENMLRKNCQESKSPVNHPFS